ncbi:hypothetical protein [Geminicoccus harenae]|uniref:hypothetical protein n=1 Tax=Geminicoccus harenae TaxID=2498453 RepID=UPI00168B78E3|nr:hypothetical protein [Geminicoccus harenae]
MAEPGSAPAIVVFEDRSDCRWLAWLKPGFRHCYCLIRAERGWILLDPLLQDLRLAWLDLPEEIDPVEYYIHTGRIVLSGWTREFPRSSLRARPITCVEVVKRALGLGGRSAWTPYQLHSLLLREGWTRHAA